MTTHSDFLIETLNNSMRWGFVSKTGGSEKKHESNDILDPDKVAAYLFKMDENLDTYVEKMTITKEEGIPESQFAEVRMVLYNEAIDLDRMMNLGRVSVLV